MMICNDLLHKCKKNMNNKMMKKILKEVMKILKTQMKVIIFKKILLLGYQIEHLIKIIWRNLKITCCQIIVSAKSQMFLLIEEEPREVELSIIRVKAIFKSSIILHFQEWAKIIGITHNQ